MAVIRKNLFSKLDQTLFKSIESATTLCKLRGNPYVELVHWLKQLWQDDDNDFKRIVRHFALPAEEIESGLAQNLATLPSGAASIIDFSYHIELAIERAWICASLECLDGRIRSGHLLLAMLSNRELQRNLYTVLPSLKKIALDQLNDELTFITRGSPEEAQTATEAAAGYGGELPGEASQALSVQATATLAQYTTDLTALAGEGKIDPVLGRSLEISTMIDILLRRRQNNPLLTGEAGVGKTAVVEGLAQAIVAKQVPPALLNVRLLMLDVVALSAGASMKGEFEARLKAVLDETMASPQPIILFIDEVHTLMGAGGNAGTGDAANLLKPALARGQLRTIAATTWGEFKRHIEKDPALTRRFQVLQVDEPDEPCAQAMLRGVVPALEKHHGVWISDDAVQAAVKLSHRYIPARQLPDKAISLLDTACARVAVGKYTPPSKLQKLLWQQQSLSSELKALYKAQQLGRQPTEQIASLEQQTEQASQDIDQWMQHWQQECDCVREIQQLRQRILQQGEEETRTPAELQQQLLAEEDKLQALRPEQTLIHADVNQRVIAEIVADWTGIPVGQMLKDELQAVLDLPQRLNTRVIGQAAALQQLSESVMTARAGLADPRKPLGVFMLVGPSGVGKTETALALAESIYGGEQNLITINMSEYQESHTVSLLKGAPPGYVGYGEGGVLTEAVRRKPYSVVLLDEIEKAHPDVHELFYQVFDKGVMDDGNGQQIDFKNTIILLTSNAASDLLYSLCADEETAPDNSALLMALQPELLRTFPAAFLGRVSIIPYLPLQNSTLNFIVRLHLQRLAKRLQDQHQVTLTYKQAVLEQVVQHCPVAETGARMLIKYIEQIITPLIAQIILQSDDRDGKTVLSLDYKLDGFNLKWQKEEEPQPME